MNTSFEFKDKYDINGLLEIMAILRSENGCPWDKEQTHKSIRNDFLEEVYEAVDAIDADDPEHMREELGDVLLQVVFHCQIEKEQKNFDFDAICDELCHKLIERHPHVFGELSINNADDVLKNWDKIKKEAKHQTYTQTLEDIPKALPALFRAQKIGKRAGRAGMDFNTAEDALSCVEKETAELKEAMLSGNSADIQAELGDLLFSCVNTARKLGINAEEALSEATAKFVSRFGKVEELVSADGLDMKELKIEKLNEYWDKIKHE